MKAKGLGLMVLFLVLLGMGFIPEFGGTAERVIKLGHVLDTKHPYHNRG
jgi:hypothetical protein